MHLCTPIYESNIILQKCPSQSSVEAQFFMYIYDVYISILPISELFMIHSVYYSSVMIKNQCTLAHRLLCGVSEDTMKTR